MIIINTCAPNSRARNYMTQTELKGERVTQRKKEFNKPLAIMGRPPERSIRTQRT